MIWAKVIAALLLLAALAGAVKWSADTIHKAGERDAAVARVAEVEKEKADLATQFVEARARDVAIAAELAALRQQRAADHQAFSDYVAAQSLTHEVPIAAGQTTVRVRDSHRYRCLFNRAITGKADSDCVL